MTTTVVNSNTSYFNFAAGGDTLIVMADGTIGDATGDAISTSFGEAFVTILGSVAGYAGFVDSSSTGGYNQIVVGQNGALVGADENGIDIVAGGNNVTNAGLIYGLQGVGMKINGAGNSIVNSGSLEGVDGAIADGGHDRIHNSGTISSSYNQYNTISEATGDDTIVNSGLISGNSNNATIDIFGSNNTITNGGSIEGSQIGVVFVDGGDRVSNTGKISGEYNGVEIGGSLGGSVITNSGLIEVLSASGVAINFQDNGAGDALSNSGTVQGDVVFGGGGAYVGNSGRIAGNISFALGNADVANTGDIYGNIQFKGDNNAYYGAAGTIEGDVYVSGSTGVYIGGAGGTTFSIGAAVLSATDQITGGGSANDTLDITGKGTILAHSLKNVTGFETLSLGASESIFIRESVADTAAGHALTIRTSGADTVNLASVTSATDAVTVWGAAGDIITAGASLDTFGFASAGASTGSGYDLIAGVNFAHDKFDVTTNIDAVTGINTAVTSGKLSTATFNTDLAADLGSTKLGADHAVLFKASSGTLAGDTFLVVDLNGTAGYQANSDLVIRLTGATGTLTMGNFV